MYPFWNSNFGKIIIGGCGTQLGLLMATAGVLAITVVCGVCAFANLLTLNLSQGLAGQPTSSLVEQVSFQPPPPNPAVQSLIAEVDALTNELDAGQSQGSTLPFIPPEVAGQALAIAAQQPVVLYDGPGADFGQVGILPVGQRLNITGRSSDSNWWLVALPDGRFAWLSNQAATILNASTAIPVASVPSQLAQPAAASGSAMAAATTAPAGPVATPTPALPPGTPTPGAEASRENVEDTPAYQTIKWQLMIPPQSASFSPDGDQVALTEGIKLYTFRAAGSYPTIWLSDTDELRPLGGAVWSPDGQYLAFVIEIKPPKCNLCHSVGVVNMATGELFYLEGPNGLQTDAPRWTQDGRILVNAHPGEPADGITYVYNVYGEGQEATGIYTLSASHEGQKWYPWLPGRVWQAGVSERPDSYYAN
ncbi:MAG: PD40 domain-containing protein [Anaerolineae bacterium]|nr:PD40 domain-containing protein [Anaerolineae bacterium]MCB0223759.1 PD40 domain-containing protein [Anaerolineae bacterium]MCB9106964.1 PD40 domain-containing protein [Anaerolineales bacterium]